MEKRTPHYKREEIQAVVATRGATAFSRVALINGHSMGLTTAEMIQVICCLTRDNFYKSMTAYHDHTAWQDVYHAITSGGTVAYIKISNPQGGRPVIQFKEK